MTTTNKLNILISGGGVAGLAAAFWFANRGDTVTVVERSDSLRTGGHAVDFRGQATEALRRMDLYETVIENSTGDVDTWYVDSRGRRRATLPQDVMGGEVEVVRGDLLRILYTAATAAGAVVRFSASITAISPEAVTLADGSRLAADLVIAADGLHSSVRSMVFGDESGFVRTLGYTAAVFSTDNFLGLQSAGRFYSCPDRTVGVTSERDPHESRVALYFADPAAERPRSVTDRRALLRAYFGADGWALPDILERLDAAQDVYFDPMSVVHAERYAQGNVVLLGDAGYSSSPLSGMGTSLAIIGAYVLAHEIDAAPDLAAGTHAYEQRMRPLVEECQKLAEGAAQFFVPGNRAMIAIRNLTYRLMPYLPWRKVFAEIPTRAANTIRLPEQLIPTRGTNA